MNNCSHIVHELKRHYLFAALSDDVLTKISQSGRLMQMENGDVLFRKGDPGDFFFCVLKGSIQIGVDVEPGRFHLMNVLSSGAVFGEVALLDGMPRTADAVADGQVQLFTLHRNDFRKILIEECQLEELLLRLLCERIRWISDQVEQKDRAKMELRKLSQAVEHSPSIVMITDRAGTIEYVNPKFSAITGWSSADVVGKTPQILNSDLTPREIYHDMWATIQSGAEWRGELRSKKKDGSLYWARCSISSIFDEEGNLTHFVAVMEDITEYKQLQDELSRLATSDPLTGIANRRHFLNCAIDEIKRSHRTGLPISVIMLDADHFKRINDTFGHAGGDAALVALVNSVKGGLREIDIFGRLGGEEFGIILPGADLEMAVEAAERLRESLRHAKTATPLTVSVGVSKIAPGEPTPDLALKRADEAVYRAKAKGRDRVEVEFSFG
ncbi:MAG: diguanylate cyclase [Alphaproteobacteria bacterium]|nr:diguanylate cyclase [Alphaproteobacteria bacterium]